VDYPNVLGLLAIFGSAVFAIMNILVGVNAARVFGGSQAMGGVMAGILSSPALAQITLFGEALQPGRGGVIAVLLVVALMCWVEKRLRTLLPESVELILNPLLTTLVTASLAILILQPIGGIISDAIAHGANLAIDKGGLLVGALLSGLFLPLVLSGLHQGLVPIHVELVQAHGSNPLLPILAMARCRAGGGGAGGAVENPQRAAEEGDQRGVAGRHSRHRRAADLRGGAAAGPAVYRRLPRRCGWRSADQLLEGGDGDHLRHFGAAFGVDHRLR
jgi:phosphotransferase system  glucose/maltose/N-acetylglucosamine-specific IIC component